MNEQNHMDEHALYLIHGSIDGELNTVEQAELDQLLATSGKIRDLNAELVAFNGLLDSVPEVEPPQFLQDSIERQIRLPAQERAKTGFFVSWLPANWLRAGFALAAGAVLTVGVYEMGSKPITVEDASNLVGTMVKSQAADQGELLDSIHIFTDTLNGLVELRSKDAMYSLEVQLTSDGPTQVVVDFAGRGLEFEGVSRMQDQKDAVSLKGDSVNVASSGEQRYTLNLRRTTAVQDQDSAPLELDFFANDILVHEAELQISKQ